MTTKSHMDEYIERIKRIDWMSAPAPTPEAEAKLREYARRLGVLARHFASARGFTLIDTDTHVAEVGMQLPESERLIRVLFDALKGQIVREHLVYNLHANYFWDSDFELAGFENPFEPLFELYEQGYTTAGGVADGSNDKLEMTLGSKAGIKTYVLKPE
jgi:hypothetical protein